MRQVEDSGRVRLSSGGNSSSPPRMWPAAVIAGIGFFIFAAVEWSVIRQIARNHPRDIFGWVSVVFESFWVLAWSAAVVVLGLLTVFLALASMSDRVMTALVARVTRFGPVAKRIAIAAAPGRHDDPAAIPVASPRSLKWVSGGALIASNLFPLVGVLFFGWNLQSIMVLYWAESAIVGFFTILKICIVGGLAAILAVPFFAGHFGAFMTIHFLLLYGLFFHGVGTYSLAADPGAREVLLTIFSPLQRPLVLLVISHGVSFVDNFLRGGEYQSISISDLMTAPYARIVVMHLTLLVGGWVILLTHAPTGALAVLVILKTIADWRAHQNEHRERRPAEWSPTRP